MQTGLTDVESRNLIAREYNRQIALYGTAPVVTAPNLTPFGSARYDGAMRIRVDTPATTEVLGEAVIDVNFFTDDIAASFGDFFGQANGGAVTAWTESTPVVATGDIDVTQPGGQFAQTTLRGVLTNGAGNVLTLGPMPLDGTFRDTAPNIGQIPDAMVLQSGPGSIRLDGLNYANEGGSSCETCVWVIAEN